MIGINLMGARHLDTGIEADELCSTALTIKGRDGDKDEGCKEIRAGMVNMYVACR